MSETQHKINNRFFRKLIHLLYYRRNKIHRDFLIKMMPKNGVCAEIGVLNGDFSLKILEYAKPKKLYLIDAWAGNDVYSDELCRKNYDEVINKFSGNSTVEIIKSDSLKALKQFQASFFDWVYIDAEHNYSNVKTDLEQSFRTVKTNGFICGDNYMQNDHTSKDVFPGVTKAVNEFINKYPVSRLKIYFPRHFFKHFQFILLKQNNQIVKQK